MYYFILYIIYWIELYYIIILLISLYNYNILDIIHGYCSHSSLFVCNPSCHTVRTRPRVWKTMWMTSLKKVAPVFITVEMQRDAPRLRRKNGRTWAAKPLAILMRMPLSCTEKVWGFDRFCYVLSFFHT